MSTDVTDLVSSSDLEMDSDLDTERQSFRRQRWVEAAIQEMFKLWIFRTRISTATIPKNLTILEEPSDGDIHSH